MIKSKYKTIGMVVAMDKEIAPFLKEMGKAKKEYKIAGHKVLQFKLKNKNIYLVKSGIGEIYAASATTILISLFKCDLILNFGVCGSLIDEVGVLQAIAVSGVVHYDFDLSEIDDVLVGQYPNYNEPIIKTDKSLVDLALSINKNLKSAVCASADKFVAKEKDKKYLHKTFGADVCDMECASVLLTCNNAKIPCLIIKAVSDGKGGAEEFNSRVKEASKVYIQTVKEIVNIL